MAFLDRFRNHAAEPERPPVLREHPLPEAAVRTNAKKKMRDARILGQDDVLRELNAELDNIAQEIRQDWHHDLVHRPELAAEFEAHYEGRIHAYNKLANAIHTLDERGIGTAQVLPEILHPEGVKLAAEQNPGREIAWWPDTRQGSGVETKRDEARIEEYVQADEAIRQTGIGYSMGI